MEVAICEDACVGGWIVQPAFALEGGRPEVDEYAERQFC